MTGEGKKERESTRHTEENRAEEPAMFRSTMHTACFRIRHDLYPSRENGVAQARRRRKRTSLRERKARGAG